MHGPFGTDWTLDEDGKGKTTLPADLVPLLSSADGDALHPETGGAKRADLVPYQADGETLTANGDLRELTGLLDLPRADALETLAAVGSRLTALHDDGRVHGDVRPETCARRAERAVLLAPAQAVDAGALLRARLRCGADPDAVAYAAPEVVAGQEGTAASDVYAVAALAYRVLAGRPPLGRLVVGLVAKDLGSELPGALSRGLHADPAERADASELTEALRDAAQRARELDAFQLVDDDAPATAAERLTDEEVEQRAEREREGSQVSALLVLVLLLGGIFVFVGALGLVIAGWSAIGTAGQFIVLGMFTGGVMGIGWLLERRDYQRSGFTLIVLGTQLLWVNVIHLLVQTDVADQAAPWALASALLVGIYVLLALRRRSVTFGWLASFGFIVTVSTFGQAISTGTLHGPLIYFTLVAGAYAGIAALGHRLAPRPTILGVPFAVGSAVWLWVCAVSCIIILADDDGGALAFAWPYALTAASLGAAWKLKGPYRIAALVAAVGILLVTPSSQVAIGEGETPYLMLVVMLGLSILACAFKVPPLARDIGSQIATVFLGLINALLAPSVMCLAECMDRDGLAMLSDALSKPGQVHDTRFAYLAIPLGTAMGLVGLGYLFSRGAQRKAVYRILEVAGLLTFFGLLTLLSLPDVDDEFFFVSVLALGGAIVLGLGIWGRRAMLAGVSAVALLLNLIIQYFAKLSEAGLPVGLLAVGFGIGLLAAAILWERKVKGLLPRLKSWA